MPDSIPSDTQAQLGGSSRRDYAEWVYARIEGTAATRGSRHGYLLANELREALRCIRYLIFNDTGMRFDWFAANAQAILEEMLRGNFGGKLTDGSGIDVIQEMEGIVSGANINHGPDDATITLADVIGWNA